MRQLSRDPFARQSLVSESIHHNGQWDCDWCGNKGRKLKDGFRLFRYGTDPDSGRLGWFRGLFCCISCFRAYHDE